MGLCSKIVETVSGSVTSTKQYIWANGKRKEERDGSGALTKKYFALGQMNSTSSYFYSVNHLGSVYAMTDSSGIAVAEYSYEPYGQQRVQLETVASDKVFAGYFAHARSGLCLTLTREFQPKLGRWICRDLLEERPNLYSYIDGSPLATTDLTGLDWRLYVGWTKVYVAPQYSKDIIFGYHANIFVVEDGTVISGWGATSTPGTWLLTATKRGQADYNQAGAEGGLVVIDSGKCHKDALAKARDLEKAWNSIGLPWTYGPTERNSNTAAYSVLQTMGYEEIPSPPGIPAPGWGPLMR